MSQKGNPTDVVMPQLAESLVSATIAKWLKQPGETVEQYEPICEVITDKVNAEIPSVLEGVMGELLAAEGQEVAVGEVICQIYTGAGSAESASSAPAASAPSNAPAQTQPAVSAPVQSTAAPQRQSEPAAAAGTAGAMSGRYSPAVQSLASEHGLNLSLIQGTGAGGRITRRDVLKALENGTAQAQAPAAQQSTAPSAPAAPPASAAVTTDYAVRNSGMHLSETPAIPKIELEQAETAPARGEHLIDVTPLRNAIARNMRQSVSEIPHAWTMIEVDVTNLVMLRNKLKEEFKRSEGITLTYLPFLIKAVVNAIKDYPIMNSVWAVDKIIVKRDINVSLAVGTEDSVMTPVIQRADQKNIAGLAHEIEDLARRTREGKLKLDDMQGGTFTVNNTGSFGSVLSYPIINYPQAAILTFESIVKRPVVINDMIGVRSMVNLCLSLDHRILDGVICGRFLQRVKDNLESYNLETKLY
ncbi:dihydrolipoamide acetyltransferase family protein [Paenibacillus bovis]|uniref:Dihydrolipoamide acetyltransferase component of pyruvate dehydrogenase complex n=1 Tax=Paenibacillus bovis TaxID=1616788 RepID=A0A172ZIQ0_9BACL|nr:dihydrolipoamide acetyltransferase family protein [Paenibacillus bovis]ANF97511.1 branched-chain alpha-keto acid dehydrogenase subunit E2 [Paenibacillus bovis]